MVQADHIKRFIDASFLAKEIVQMMPELPDNLSPRAFYVLDCIKLLSATQRVKISDISDTLRVTKPSITKLINELAAKNVVVKTQDEQDKRIFWLSLTALGEQYHDQYLVRYHRTLMDKWSSIKVKDFETTIQTINNAYRLMKE